MNCPLTPPQSLQAFSDVVSACAESYGGPAWQQTALTGLATLVVIAALVLLVGVIAWAAK